MTKISINCGHCGVSKGCEIKKEFRELASKYYYERNEYSRFKLYCPFRSPKFKEGQKVEFTVSYGSHKVAYDWECDWDLMYGDVCSGCKNLDNCNDGIVRFYNTRYKGSIKLTGEILSEYKNGFSIIVVKESDFRQVGDNFNKDDIKKINDISEKIDTTFTSWLNMEKYISFISKNKYIKEVCNG